MDFAANKTGDLRVTDISAIQSVSASRTEVACRATVELSTDVSGNISYNFQRDPLPRPGSVEDAEHASRHMSAQLLSVSDPQLEGIAVIPHCARGKAGEA